MPLVSVSVGSLPGGPAGQILKVIRGVNTYSRHASSWALPSFCDDIYLTNAPGAVAELGAVVPFFVSLADWLPLGNDGRYRRSSRMLANRRALGGKESIVVR
jgi:hypothetical protein